MCFVKSFVKATATDNNCLGLVSPHPNYNPNSNSHRAFSRISRTLTYSELVLDISLIKTRREFRKCVFQYFAQTWLLWSQLLSYALNCKLFGVRESAKWHNWMVLCFKLMFLQYAKTYFFTSAFFAVSVERGQEEKKHFIDSVYLCACVRE